MSNHLLNRLFLTLLCSLFFCIKGLAQNLVLNPSFEQYSTCPNNLSQLSYCSGWTPYSTGTPDYFNSCATSLITGVPNNNFGSRAAANGQAYAGLITYVPSSYREYITTTITPMQIGTLYEVSMSVSLADSARYGSNGLGVYFFDTGQVFVNNNIILPITPQVSYDNYGLILNKANWVRLTNYFLADSAYDHIVIAGFHDNNIITSFVGGRYNEAYYYIDSVAVKIAGKINFTYPNNLLCVGDTIMIPYAVWSNYFSSGNVFKLQLSNSSGSFSSPIIIGSVISNSSGNITGVIPSSITAGSNYRIRIVSTNPVDSSIISQPLTIGTTLPAKPVAASNSPICNGDTLKLSATSTTSGVNYIWSGPSGFNSILQTPQILGAQISASGLYIVSAYLLGCSRKDTVNVLVSQSPSTSFNATTNIPCATDTLRLTTTTVLSGTTFSWTGPNGFSSTIQSPKIGFPPLTAAGKYYVTATLNGCSVYDSVNVTIKQAPQKPIASNNGPICEGDSILLTTYTTTTGVSYNWTGPNSFNSTIQNPKIINATTAADGSYISTVSLNGCNSKDTTIVTIKTYAANVTISSNYPVCTGDSIKLNISSTTSGLIHSWTGPANFSSALQNPYRTNAISAYTGDYIDTIDHNGCKSTKKITIVVSPLPNAPSATNNGPLCSGATLNLSTVATTGVNYSWTGPNSFVSTAQNPIRLYMTTADSGNYIVIANLNGCTLKDSTHVTVYPVTPKPVASGNNPVCLGAVLNLNASNIPNALYNWTGPNNFFSPLQNTKISNTILANAGTYKVTAKLNGCVSAPDSVVITTIPGPSVSAYANPGSTICTGASVALVAVPTNIGTNPAAYQWYQNNNAISGATSVSYIAPSPINGDVFYVQMTASTVCNSPVSSNNINIATLPTTPPPAATIAANPGTDIWPGLNVNFSISSLTNGGSAPSYQWRLNGKDISGATANKWNSTTLKDGDSVCLWVTSSDQCASPKSTLSNCLRMKVPVGVSPLNPLTGDLYVYPNPATSSLVIEGATVGSAIQVNNIIGQTVYRGVISNNKDVINTTQWSQGAYLLHLTDKDGKRVVRKVVKE